jgi:hypothetical protein
MRPINEHWKGMLTIQNAEEVGAMFNRIFGRKRFTYTRVRPDIIPSTSPLVAVARVDIYPGVKLQRQIGKHKVAAVSVSREDGTAMLTINTTDWLCMYDTRLDVPVAQYDILHKNPYVAFGGDRCEFRWQTPCGDQTVDVFVIESR